jgi:hypothetical protein
MAEVIFILFKEPFQISCMKKNPFMLVIIVLVIAVIVILSAAGTIGRYSLDRTCQDGFAGMEIAVLGGIDSLRAQSGLEFARTVSVFYTNYDADVKTPQEMHGVFCTARVALCKKENGEIQYCQEYDIPFGVEV